MKKTIISCTVAICAFICTVGYFIACAASNGAYSNPIYYLHGFWPHFAVIFFTVISVAGIAYAIKDAHDNP